MTGLRYLAVLLVVTVLAFSVVYLVDSPPPEERVHVLGFDNRYGSADRLTIHVSVDKRPEQPNVATCGPVTCTFKLPLPDGPHEILISVEHNGRRSAPSRMTVDTTKKGERQIPR